MSHIPSVLICSEAEDSLTRLSQALEASPYCIKAYQDPSLEILKAVQIEAPNALIIV